MLIGAARRLRSGLATGIDIWSAKDLSGNTIENARRNIASEGVETRTKLLTQDAARLEFPDGSFDVAVSLLCLHNNEPMSSRENACREIGRVLKPGGKAVISDDVPTGGYARVLRECGLDVKYSKPTMHIALGLMWTVVARKER